MVNVFEPRKGPPAVTANAGWPSLRITTLEILPPVPGSAPGQSKAIDHWKVSGPLPKPGGGVTWTPAPCAGTSGVTVTACADGAATRATSAPAVTRSAVIPVLSVAVM